jgi:xylose isomerase
MSTDIKFAVILGFMGQQRDRFQVFGPPYTLEEKFERTAHVELCGAVELLYPAELGDVAKAKELLDRHNLKVSSVNVNIKADEIFHRGALTSCDPAVRAKAVAYIKAGMDLAPELGTDIVTCCPLGDGTEYAFQMDYIDSWGWFVDGIREAAKHRSDVKLSLEYKKSETRAHCVMPSATSALHAAQQTGLDNVGVTVDIGHALYVAEIPSLSLAQCAAANRLFLIHINDNYRDWDWDLVPGSVNWWDWVECMLYIDKIGYDGWLVSDVMSSRLDTVSVMNAVGKSIVRAKNALARVDNNELWALVKKNDALAAYDLFYASLGLD